MISLEALFQLSGGRCFYCDCETWIPMRVSRARARKRFGVTSGIVGAKKAMEHRRATREHIVRVTDGGTDARHNLVLACQFCNVSRGAAPSGAYKVAVAKAIAAGLHPNHEPRADLPKKALRRARRSVGLLTMEAAHVG